MLGRRVPNLRHPHVGDHELPDLGRTLPDASAGIGSGYHETPEGAIVEGGCLWACTFVPLLRCAFTGAPTPDDVGEFESVIAGQRCRVHVSAMHRQLSISGPFTPAIDDATERLAGGVWLSRAVVDAGTLPVLPHQPTILSVFIGEGLSSASVEVRVNGGDWSPSQRCFSPDASAHSEQMLFLRELALITPIEPLELLQRADIERTLAGIAESTSAPWLTLWPGWQAHGGRLAAPMTEAEVASVESSAGPLPAEYRSFLTTVAASGAGPGYGLLPPQRIGQELLLAHAGCDVTWWLRLVGPHRGTVWVDATGSDQRLEQVATTFDEWYRSWLDNAVRCSEPWLQWDARCCASPAIISQFLDHIERTTGTLRRDLSDVVQPGAITITAGGDGAVPAGTLLDPCQGCVALVQHFGLDASVYVGGTLRG